MTGIETALLIGATGMSALSSISQGNAAKTAGYANAAVMDANAASARASAKENARRSRRAADKALGTLRLTGRSMDLLEDNAKEAELEAQTLLWRGEAEAINYSNQAAVSRWRGKQAQKQGFMSAATQLLMGGASMAGGGGFNAAAGGTQGSHMYGMGGGGLRDASGFIR